MHPPWVEDALGIKALLEPPGQGGESWGLGIEHRYRRADIGFRPQQGRAPASLADGGTYRFVTGVAPRLDR